MSLFDNRNLFSEDFSKFMKKDPIGEFIHNHPFLFLAIIGVIVGACTGGIATVIAVGAIIGGIILDDVSSNDSFILRKVSSFFKMFKTGPVGDGVDDKSEVGRTSYNQISDKLPRETSHGNNGPAELTSRVSSRVTSENSDLEKEQIEDLKEVNDQINPEQNFKI